MYQILLVDDEPLACQHVRSLSDWGSNGFEICGEAYNGMMALEMIRESPPHIAVIDVDMPEMNGVELQRAITERFPAVKTVMLSSYDDYDYVRECLKNGATDYVLKHRLDSETLLATLNKAMRDLQEENRSKASRPSVIREHIADLVRGKQGAVKELEAYARKNGLYAEAVGYVAAVVQIVPFFLMTESSSDVQTNQLMQRVVDLIQQALGDIRERTVAYVGEGRFAIVLAARERSEHGFISETDTLMAKIRYQLALGLNMRCIYKIGYICSTLAKLGDSYTTAVRMLDDHSPTDSSRSIATRHSLTIDEQKQLLLALERLDREGVQRLIESVFDSLSHLPLHFPTVQLVVRELLHIGDKAWMSSQTTYDTDTATSASLPSRRELSTLENIDELQRWTQHYYDVLLEQIARWRSVGPHSRHISQAIQLILEHYEDSLSLESAARHVGLNPSYLSRLFKEETGSTFSEYLNRIRIGAACKLLEMGGYSVKEISRKAGFPNYNYFFKVFKEMTGVTPQAYMKKISS